MTSHDWYAIRVKSNRERMAADALRGKGLQVFLPVYHRRRMRNGTMSSLPVPLFPGYLFCRFDVRTRLPILTVPGVVNIVGIGKEPHAVEEAEMGRLLALAESNLPLTPLPYLLPGEHVRIQRGPLRGIEGVILSTEDQDRLVVSVSLLQRSVAVDVERGWLGPDPHVCFAA